MQALGNILDIAWLVTAGLVIVLSAVVWYLRFSFPRRLEKIVHDAVVEAGAALRDAEVTVHSATAVAAPKDASPYDLDKDDENFMEGIDGEPWDENECSFYSIDVTIEPADANVKWDPTGLAVVPSDFVGDDDADLGEDLGGLHSAQIFVNGRFRPAPEREVRGPHRVRLLFGVPHGVRAIKFANFVTYFGHVDLPEPLTKDAGSRC
jgi:hypothetical protein